MKPEHWRQAYNAEASVLAALKDWVAGASGLSRLGCELVIRQADGAFMDDGTGEGSWASLLAERGQDAKQPHLAVSIEHGNGVSNLHIGSTLLSVEAECPGLAGTVLSLIRSTAQATLDVIDPARIMQLASWTYWGGDNDETAMVEEMDGDIDLDHLVTRSMLDEHAPKWAWFPIERLSMKALTKITRDSSLTERVRAIATACLSVKKFLKQIDLPSPYRGLHFTECIGVSACLWWVDKDACLMSRIWDDYEENMMQGGDGFLEGYGIDTFEATESGFNGWLKQKEQWFDLARRLETLIGLVGVEMKHE